MKEVNLQEFINDVNKSGSYEGMFIIYDGKSTAFKKFYGKKMRIQRGNDKYFIKHPDGERYCIGTANKFGKSTDLKAKGHIRYSIRTADNIRIVTLHLVMNTQDSD